jgi:cyclophilin family peptidyl-prolyl cis-trans isomerase
VSARTLSLLLAILLSGCIRAPAPDAPAGPGGGAPVAYDAIEFETDMGLIKVILYPEAAPKTVELMKTLVKEGYYDGREFNRAVPGHVIQLVDKAGGATDDPRKVPLEVPAGYHFSAGAAGIARGEDPNSGGPEFFLMDFGTSHLDGNYTVWGQAIEGLPVIHRAARVDAVEFKRVPAPANQFMPSDRLAIAAAKIVSAKVTNVTLPGEEAAKYPMVVAKNRRAGDFRHSLEWPRNLRPGAASDLTWYARPYNATVPPDAAGVKIRVGGTEVPATGEAGVPGVYHWTWTPPAKGVHDATLTAQGQDVMTLQIVVA